MGVAAAALVLPNGLGQRSAQPRIIRRVPSETVPDKEIEKAIITDLAGLRAGDTVRYYYSCVDRCGDGNPEVLAYIFGPRLCGTGGCSALVFSGP